jgi:hypothetical protein
VNVQLVIMKNVEVQMVKLAMDLANNQIVLNVHGPVMTVNHLLLTVLTVKEIEN